MFCKKCILCKKMYGLCVEKYAEKWSKMNEKLREDCPKYGIEYIDTSKNRNKILIDILEKLDKEIIE